MMRKAIAILTLTFCTFLLTACTRSAISQYDYDLILNERDKAIQEKESTKEKYDNLYAQLTAAKDKLKEFEEIIEPYKELSEADLLMRTNESKLKAEEDRIELESLQKKEEEEKAEKEKAEKEAREKEEKLGYNTGLTYDQLARTPDEYVGKKVKFTGKVIQVMEGSAPVQLRLAVDSDYDSILYITYFKSIVTSRILEDDTITIYGYYQGLHSYQSTLGGVITIPFVSVDKIDQ